MFGSYFPISSLAFALDQVFDFALDPVFVFALDPGSFLFWKFFIQFLLLL